MMEKPMTAAAKKKAPAKPRGRPKKVEDGTRTDWMIKGIRNEVQTSVRLAAKQSGKTIGAWVDTALEQVANEQLGTGKKTEVGKTSDDMISEFIKMQTEAMIEVRKELAEVKASQPKGLLGKLFG